MIKNKLIGAIALITITGLSISTANALPAVTDVEATPKVIERFSDYKMQFLNLEYSDQQAIINSLSTYLEKRGDSSELTSKTTQGILAILLNDFEKSVKNLNEATPGDKELAKDRLSTLDTIIAKEVEDRVESITTSALINSLKFTSTGNASIIGDINYTSMGDIYEESFRLDLTDYSLMQNIYDMVLKADMSFEMDSQTLGGNITAEGTFENIQKNGKQYLKFSDIELNSDISEIQENLDDIKNEIPVDKYLLIGNPDTQVIAALQNISSDELSNLLIELLSTSDLEVISTNGDRVYLSLTQKSCNRIKSSMLGISELFGNGEELSKSCSKADLSDVITDLGQIYLDIEENTTSINLESFDGLKIVVTYNDSEIISTGISYMQDSTELVYKQVGDNFSLEIKAPDTTFAFVQKDKTIAGKLAVQTGDEKITGTIAGKGDMLSLDVQDLTMNIDITDANGGKIGSFSFIKELGNYSLNIAIGSFYSLSGKYTSSEDDSVDFEATAKVLGSQIFMLQGNGSVNDDGADIKYNGKIIIPSNAEAEFSGSAKTEKSGNNTKQDFIYKLDLETNIEEFEKLDLNLQIISDETRIKGKTTQVQEPSNYETINY